ncbi:MAG: AAA family ATPase [Gammaproteobacteria bacterium]|nr:AAA family ATPase [Gammaproteobacteria bacterium]
MYEQEFGLKKRPFRASASGTDVFVGPQTATILAGLKKALAADDAIVTVAGPIGSGKTTLVNRALESMGTNCKVIRLARMRLESKDVLEFLLDELAAAERPNGIIQKFGLFRRCLKDLEIRRTRVFIAVEDMNHLGVETLAELEALTAADAGESGGASVILMGDEDLDKMLLDTKLARVKQRIRHRFTVAPLCAAELRGYLRHCFRLAGGEFERLFEINAAPLLHHLAGGVLRTTNKLVDAAMAAASDQDLRKISSGLLARVAENEFGLSAAGFDLNAQPTALPVLTPAAVSAKVTTPAAAAVTPPPAAELAPRPPAAPVAKPAPAPAPKPVVEAPAIVFAATPRTEEAPAEVEIPELIQDTLPDLQILAPALAMAQPESIPELQPEPAPKAQPEPAVELRIAAESDGDDVPAWDRDPTVAELRPDIEALEAALAFGRSDDPAPVAAIVEPLPKPQPKAPDVIPEITLDHAISQRIANNLIDEPGEISKPKPETSAAGEAKSKPAYNPPKKAPRQADAELEKIASELAKAKSLEDIDDRMAETLFGDEINFAAAQFMANRPRDFSANDDNDEIMLASSEHPVSGNGAGPGVRATLETARKLDDSGMDLSASQRLKTVRALNTDHHSAKASKPVAGKPDREPVVKPEPIEDQINTSMTQTLKALNVRPPVNDDDIDDGDAKRGFFSRFKRS